MRASRLFRATAIAALLPLTGCSLAFVRPPAASAPPDFPPDCTRSRAAPILDAAVILGGIAFSAAVLHACSQRNCESAGPAYVVMGTALAALPLGLSALYGFHTASRCDEAWREWCVAHPCAPDEAR
jgi:hypothetical protein